MIKEIWFRMDQADCVVFTVVIDGVVNVRLAGDRILRIFDGATLTGYNSIAMKWFESYNL
jgi:hypothetical protein